MSYHGTESIATLICYRTFIRAVSGGAAGSFSISLLYPLETVRTRLQVDDKRDSQSTLQCLVDIVTQEGLVALFKGWWSLVVGLWVTNFVYFYVFNSLRLTYVSVHDADQAVYNDLLFGIVAGGAAVIISNPLWVVNTRLKLQGIQLNVSSTQDAFDRRNLPIAANGEVLECLVNIVRREGLFALWSGLLSSLVLVVNPAINFMIYEALKRNLFPVSMYYVENDSAIFFAFGAASKFTATVITYPMQLIQTRARAGIAIPSLHQWSMWSRILFMYRGLKSKLMQTVLNSALMLMAYERIETVILLLFTLHRDDSE